MSVEGYLADSESSNLVHRNQLLSPVAYQESSSSSFVLERGLVTSPRDPRIQASDINLSPEEYHHSSHEETQAFSQYEFYEVPEIKDDIDDEIWGYLLPINQAYSKSIILRSRPFSPIFDNIVCQKLSEDCVEKFHSRGYLIGRHSECDITVNDPVISNRHALIFTEIIKGITVAVIEDLSSNGTFVNEGIIGRNKRRELKDLDEIAILDRARFVFRYTSKRRSSKFLQQFKLLEGLGRGHFAEVFKCVEKTTGHIYAVKIFNTQNQSNEPKNAGPQQETAVLMGVSHPNMLCLKDVFEELDAVYLVMELAPDGELFNLIIKKQKLSEKETRGFFVQLFEGVKYLHDRGIVHRDIKPENILLTENKTRVKLADFGLAKIVGEESFMTSLCGTHSYVAPEVLEKPSRRQYSNTVDIWSLGVVLYICLCGFPPFSDELMSEENPYTLTEQIRRGRFDFPSPYWDRIGDPALDMIDKMLTVNVDSRFTINDCLKHRWLNQKTSIRGSASDLVEGLAELDFRKRKVARKRTLLCNIYQNLRHV